MCGFLQRLTLFSTIKCTSVFEQVKNSLSTSLKEIMAKDKFYCFLEWYVLYIDQRPELNYIWLLEDS